MSRRNIQLPDFIAEQVKTMCDNSEDLLTDIDKLFTVKSDVVTHFVTLQSGVVDGVRYGEKDAAAGITPKQEIIDAGLIPVSDYIPYSKQSRFRTLKCDRNTSRIELSMPGGETKSIPFDYQLTEDGAKGIYSIVTELMPSMIQISTEEGVSRPINLPARMTKDGYCVVLGVCFNKGDVNEMTPDQIERLNVATERVIHAVHRNQVDRALGEMRVFGSIADRADTSWSLDSASIMKGGILKKPMQISMSEKVEVEYGIPKDSEFTVSKDKTHLFITATTKTTLPDTMLLRLPFSELIDSKKRIRSSRIQTVINRSLGLNQKKDGVSKYSLQRVGDNQNETTRIGMALTFSSMCSSLYKLQNEHHLRVVPNNGAAILFHTFVPHLLFLLFAKHDPNLRREIKEVKSGGSNSKQRKNSRKVLIRRQWDWGNDLVRYISHGTGSAKSKHYVPIFSRWNRLKNKDTIERYRKDGCRLKRKGNQTFGWGLVEGHFRGTDSKPIDWDGTFNFGKTGSGPYSQKALRWLKYREEIDGIKMTRTAERGGELRIEISSGFIWADGWCKENKTVYEFHGDVWHGNPEIFADGDRCHPKNKDITAGELYRKTKKREDAIIDAGFNLEVIWEKDWDLIESEINATIDA